MERPNHFAQSSNPFGLFSVYAPLEGWQDGQTITNTAIFNDGLGHHFSRSAVTTFPGIRSFGFDQDRQSGAGGQRRHYWHYNIHLHNASEQRYLASHVRDDIPPHTTYVPGSLTATSGTVYF